MSDALRQFISHARQKGLDHPTIRHLLLAAGWKDKEIARGIAAEGLDLPVPDPRAGVSTRDSFIYLLCFAALYVVVGAVIPIYFTYLDYLFPDATEFVNLEWLLSGIRYGIAAILIAFPLFVVLNRLLEQVLRSTPDQNQPHVARWLTYLTMFLATALTVGDLIALVYYFLDGSMQTRFVLKAMVLLVIAQLVLGYFYLAPRQHQAGQSMRSLRPWLGGAGTLVVLGAVALGFTLAGSPFSARQRRLDDRRIADLKAIHETLQQMTTRRDADNRWVVTRSLPSTLAEVADYQRTRVYGRALTLSDPKTNSPYRYQVTGETNYELCAEFELPAERTRELFWNHPAGAHCFQFDLTSPP